MKKRNVFLKIFIIYIISIIIVAAISFSKYETLSYATNTVNIAAFVNTVSADIEVELAYPGCTPVVYPIKISNYEQSGTEISICDVSQSYVITLTTATSRNIPFTYALYKDEACTTQLNADSNGIYSSSDFVFKAGQTQENIVYLKLAWPENYNSESYAFEIDYITVNVIATQDELNN